MKKIFLVALVALGAVACCNCNQAKIEGAWGETSPCKAKKHGIVLNEDGTAKSCIKGLCVTSWKQEGDQLILEGKRMPRPPKCHKPCENGEKAACEKKCDKPCDKKEACKKECDKEKCAKKEGCKKECDKKCEKKCDKPCKKECKGAAEEVAMKEPMPEPIAFVDTFKIEKLTADSLILVAPCGHKLNFGRIECDKACAKKCEKVCDKKEGCKKECDKEKCAKKEGCKKDGCDKKCEKKCDKPCDKKAECKKECKHECKHAEEAK